MNVHFVSIRKKYHIDFDFVSFYSNMNFSILKLRCSLSLRYGCDLGPGHHFIVILTRQRTFQSKFLASARHYSIFVTVSDTEEHELGHANCTIYRTCAQSRYRDQLAS